MIESTHLPQAPESRPEEEESILLDLLQVVADNLRLLVLAPLLVGLATLAYTFTVTPTFTATVKFMPPQQQQSSAAAMLAGLGGLGGLAGAAVGIKNPVDQYVAFLKSQSVQDALIDRFTLSERYKEELRQDTRKSLDGRTVITSGKEGIISLSADDKDPQFSAQLANAYVEELNQLLKRLAVTEAQQRRLFFEKQLEDAKNKLVKAEQALKASGVSSNALKASPQAAIEGLAKLKAAITAQEVKLASMRGYLADTAPDFKQAQLELAALKRQVSSSEMAEASGSVGDSDYIGKFRDFKYHETLFELYAKQFELARIDESREGAVLQVLDAAQPPERKSKPKKAIIALVATLASGFLLLFYVFIRHELRIAAGAPGSSEKMRQLQLAFAKALGRH